MISILIVEDSAIVRDALRQMLEGVRGAEVVGEFDRAAPAIERIRANPPGIVVLDIQLGGDSGLEVLRAVTKEHAQVRFIIFSNLAEPIYRKRCLDCGAYAFHDKMNGLHALQQTLRKLVASDLTR